MKVLIITVEQNRGGHDYGRFIEALEQYDHKKLANLTYAIATNINPQSLQEALYDMLATGDYLYILPLASGWSVFAKDDIVEWFEAHPLE